MIPNYEKFYNSILKFLLDEKEHKVSEIIEYCAKEHDISQEERSKQYDSSKANIVYSRVHWALTYLKMAKLVDSPKKATFKITNEGKNASNDIVNNSYLKKYDSFLNFKNKVSNNDNSSDNPINDIVSSAATPEDRMESAYKEKKERIIEDLIDVLLNSINPIQFEHLVNKLLSKMNYGIAENTQATADGGIDGIIKADKFGFDKIYVQAKKWERNKKVGSIEIDKFSGAMDKFALSSPKGVFITTSEFTQEAIKSVESNKNKQIVLINGRKLAELMIDYEMGVELKEEYKIYEVNTDYFEDLS